MNSPNKLDLETSEKLLDVVFGVILGLSLLELPKAIGNLFPVGATNEWNRVILLFTSLLFGAFYWLETRHFILKQHEFNKEIKKVDKENRDGVLLPLASFLLGILGLMGFASAQLAFADAGDFLKFSVAAALFWCFDLSGTFMLKKEYKKEEGNLSLLDDKTSDGERWYIGHIYSPFFYFYGFTNLCLFVSGIGIILLFPGMKVLEPLIGLIYLASTFTRHLYVRSRFFESVTNKYEAKLRQQNVALNVADAP